MTTVYIDNRSYQVQEGDNLLHASLSLGLDLPYFCWHPALGSVGACRQCAVKQFKDEKDTKGKLVMACMTPVTDGLRAAIDDPEAREFRASVIEWLMVNHPHDCPVCDEGGECHLQDMTVMTGHAYREYRFNKRTHRNQYLGPFINHEMNRCIACYRCVRYYRDYAGGHDLDVFGAHDHVYFGRHSDGVLENEFSGNLVEVCPTGVFTDKTQKQHFTRKWDLQTAPSICGHCSLGCNTLPGERYGTLRRIRNRYNYDVNGYFLCDRGRYGYEFVNGDSRIRQAMLRSAAGEDAAAIDKHAALDAASHMLQGSRVIGIGSPRASLETNFALRALVGAEHFHQGVSAADYRLGTTVCDLARSGPAPLASLHDAAQADAVLVLGEDVTNTAPMLALALRQAVRSRARSIAADLKIHPWDDAAVREAAQGQRGPLFVATPAATRLDDIAQSVQRMPPADLARLGFALAHAIDSGAPAVKDLDPQMESLVEEIAAALGAAARPLVVTGTSLGESAILEAAANVAWALRATGREAALAIAVPESNSLGLALMGGADLASALQALQEGTADTVVIAENDLYRRADAQLVDAALQAARHVIVLDTVTTATTARADLLLPAASFAEADGTLVNNEGRGQRFYQVFVPDGDIQASWRWSSDLLRALDRAAEAPWSNLDDLLSALARALPVFTAVPEIAPPASFRIAGQKVARQSQRYSGRTAMHANLDVSEPVPPADPDTALSFSMEGYQGEPPPALIPRFWAPGWNSVQSLNKYQEEAGGPLRGDEPGRRLLEPAGDGRAAYFDRIPAPARSQAAGWRLVPLYHIFGSEPLSMLTPGIAERAPAPYIGLNPEDAAGLKVGEAEPVTLRTGTVRRVLAVHLLPSLPRGLAGVPLGLPGMPWLELPAVGKLLREGE